MEPRDEMTMRGVLALESIARSLDKIANPPEVDVSAALRKGLDAMREELPVVGIAFDSMNEKIIKKLSEQRGNSNGA